MRLFTGIEISDDVRNNLERLVQHLRPAAHLQWSPVYNLHITLKFVGAFPRERLREMTDALRKVPQRGPVSVAVQDLGWFPNPRSPRVFWAGVHTNGSLAALARDNDAALAPLGVESEAREFSPHLTLARIRQPTPLSALRTAIDSLEHTQFGAFTADRFFLYSSEPGPSGSIYTKIAEIPFAGQ